LSLAGKPSALLSHAVESTAMMRALDLQPICERLNGAEQARWPLI
jgi:hypothetical protein